MLVRKYLIPGTEEKNNVKPAEKLKLRFNVACCNLFITSSLLNSVLKHADYYQKEKKKTSFKDG